MFRCAYCLSRETWTRTSSGYDIDHVEARTIRRDLALVYDNLVYSCHGCNMSKGPRSIAIPTATNLVALDGTISALDDSGQRVIDMLSLDDAQSTSFRKKIIGIVRSTFKVSDEQETFRFMMGFPEEGLPDLSRLHCPENSRPAGIHDSWHARQQRGQLPPYYE